MNKSKNFLSLLIPSSTVFISSFCIMVLELVASRLIARHLGSSLYTWTAVIGVVLAGITIGNYLGGRIADRYPARKALAVLFGVSSVACVFVVIANNLVGEWIFLWQFSWPMRTFTHVSLVFLFPSVLLGTISPVVAKMALDQGLATGRTVGDIYACGAAGSIAGTFAAGYYLIAAMGTVAIIWIVGAVLLLIGILYWARLWVLYVWAVIFIALMSMGMVQVGWAENAGAGLALREKRDPRILYEDESQYCYIAVKQISKKPDRRLFMQDKLKHSEILMDNKYNLQYFHTVIFAAVTHGLSNNKKAISVFHIGGGGYVFPQYVEKHWPGCRNDVAEIDPDVTRAATEAFGLAKNSSINTIQMDARNYVDELLRQKHSGKEVPKYNFIYEDAFSDYSVPYQLVTKEFNDKIYEIMTDDGTYMINSIDIYDSALFLGAYVHTLEQTFPNVYVITTPGPHSNRKIFVIIASKKSLSPDSYIAEYRHGFEYQELNDSEIKLLKQKARHVTLTDDYVPVENMLTPVVHKGAVDLLAGEIHSQAKSLRNEGNLNEAIDKYYELSELDSTMSILAYNEIALMKAAQGNLNGAIEYFNKALQYNENSQYKSNMANIHFSLAVALKKTGRLKDASIKFAEAIKGYKKQLKKEPGNTKLYARTGDAFAELGKFTEASVYFSKAVNLDPLNMSIGAKLIQSLDMAGQLTEAIEAAQKAIEYFTANNLINQANQLKQYLEILKLKNSKSIKRNKL